MKKLIAQAKALWASLPHQVQAALVVFATVASTTLGKELQTLIFGGGAAAFSWLSLKHDIAAACVAGFIAARAFYMLPNRDMPAQSVKTLPAPASK
jgi:hypothetical protein